MSRLSIAWHEGAKCRTLNPDIFFPEDIGGVLRAKAICVRCDVVESCLEYALASGVDHGVWGNMSERQRRIERRRRALLCLPIEPAS